MKHHHRSAQVWHVFSRDFTVLPAHPHVHPQLEWAYLPLPSRPQLVLIYRPWRDGRLSRPWCKVAPAEIQTCNLPIIDPALYQTATSAPKLHVKAVLLYSDFYIEYRIRDWQVGWHLVIMSEFDVAQVIDRKGICPAWYCRPELCVASGVDQVR